MSDSSVEIAPYRIKFYFEGHRDGIRPDEWACIEQFLHSASTHSWEVAVEWIRRIEPIFEDLDYLTAHVRVGSIIPPSFDHTLLVALGYTKIPPTLWSRILGYLLEKGNLTRIQNGNRLRANTGLAQIRDDRLISLALQAGELDIDMSDLQRNFKNSLAHRAIVEEVSLDYVHHLKDLSNLKRVAFRPHAAFIFYKHPVWERAESVSKSL